MISSINSMYCIWDNPLQLAGSKSDSSFLNRRIACFTDKKKMWWWFWLLKCRPPASLQMLVNIPYIDIHLASGVCVFVVFSSGWCRFFLQGAPSDHEIVSWTWTLRRCWGPISHIPTTKALSRDDWGPTIIPYIWPMPYFLAPYGSVGLA